MLLPGRQVLNKMLSESCNRSVVKIEAITVQPGDVVTLRLEDTTAAWRQGVWLATDGLLSVAGSRSAQLVLWQDTAPPEVMIEVVETDGWLRFYNVWDSGRGLAGHESLMATSGMIVSAADDGWSRYECSDIAPSPSFDRLRFSIRVSARTT